MKLKITPKDNTHSKILYRGITHHRMWYLDSQLIKPVKASAATIYTATRHRTSHSHTRPTAIDSYRWAQRDVQEPVAGVGGSGGLVRGLISVGAFRGTAGV